MEHLPSHHSPDQLESSSDSPAGTVWNLSDVQFAGDSDDQTSAEHPTESPEVESPVETVSYWGKMYNDLESQFIAYSETVDLDDPESVSAYETMLRRYESEINYTWNCMDDATEAAKAQGQLNDPYSRSNAQAIHISGGDEINTVEVASSRFYQNRVAALNAAIRSDDTLSPEEAKAQLQALDQTWEKVMLRIDANQDDNYRRQDAMAHWRYCNSLHDDLIKHLNHLNSLAEQHGTERFTPRDFIPNDLNYSELRDRFGEYHRRVETDRSMVDLYFRKVFSKEYAKVTRKTSRDLGIAV